MAGSRAMDASRIRGGLRFYEALRAASRLNRKPMMGVRVVGRSGPVRLFGHSDVSPENAGRFNFCSAMEVMEHTPDPVAAMRPAQAGRATGIGA